MYGACFCHADESRAGCVSVGLIKTFWSIKISKRPNTPTDSAYLDGKTTMTLETDSPSWFDASHLQMTLPT